ncbi:MAG: hypothetical protein ACXVCY_17375 [Pseudobdellovibrionaceae bacterium]
MKRTTFRRIPGNTHGGILLILSLVLSIMIGTVAFILYSQDVANSNLILSKKNIRSSTDLKQYLQGALQIATHALGQRWCVTNKMDQDTSPCSLKNTHNLERLLLSKTFLGEVNALDSQFFGSTPPDSAIEITVPYDSLLPTDVLYKALPSDKSIGSGDSLIFKFEKQSNSFNLGRESVIIKVSLKLQLGLGKRLFGSNSQTVYSVIALTPRELNTYSLILSGDLSFSSTSGNSPPALQLPPQNQVSTAAGLQPDGLQFESPVYVSGNLILPSSSETSATKLSPVRALAPIVIGNKGSILSNSSGTLSSVSPNYQYGAPLYSKLSGVEFVDKIELDPQTDAGFNYIWNDNPNAITTDGTMQTCIERHTLKTALSVTGASTLIVGPISPGGSLPTGSNFTVRLGLSNQNEFRPMYLSGFSNVPADPGDIVRDIQNATYPGTSTALVEDSSYTANFNSLGSRDKIIRVAISLLGNSISPIAVTNDNPEGSPFIDSNLSNLPADMIVADLAEDSTLTITLNKDPRPIQTLQSQLNILHQDLVSAQSVLQSAQANLNSTPATLTGTSCSSPSCTGSGATAVCTPNCSDYTYANPAYGPAVAAVNSAQTAVNSAQSAYNAKNSELTTANNAAPPALRLITGQSPEGIVSNQIAFKAIMDNPGSFVQATQPIIYFYSYDFGRILDPTNVNFKMNTRKVLPLGSIHSFSSIGGPNISLPNLKTTVTLPSPGNFKGQPYDLAFQANSQFNVPTNQLAQNSNINWFALDMANYPATANIAKQTGNVPTPAIDPALFDRLNKCQVSSSVASSMQFPVPASWETASYSRSSYTSWNFAPPTYTYKWDNGPGPNGTTIDKTIQVKANEVTNLLRYKTVNGGNFSVTGNIQSTVSNVSDYAPDRDQAGLLIKPDLNITGNLILSFLIYSVADTCQIQPDVTIMAGFLVCKKIEIMPRTNPLTMIGTYITKNFVIHSPEVPVTMRSIWHPQSVIDLRKYGVLRPTVVINNQQFCPLVNDPSAPIWANKSSFGDEIKGRLNFFSCSPSAIADRVDNFRWTSLDPVCGLSNSSDITTQCKPHGRNLRFYIDELDRGSE